MRVTVVGDIILDIYKYGSVDRISPEAPVPVVNNIKTEYMPGGAANVAANLASLGIDTELYGLCGNDPEREILIKLLTKVRTIFAAFNNYNTITKTRIIAGNQQLIRLDNDCQFDGEESYHNSIIKKLNVINAAKLDAFIVSDYNKGTVGKPSKYISKINCLVYVDPKKTFDHYTGAWLVKPNEREFRYFVGDFNSIRELVKIARASLAAHNISNMLVTLGKDGMVLVNPYDHYVIHSETQSVCDVTGAGDTVMASLVYGYHQVVPVDAPPSWSALVDAAQLANHMASVAVSKVGNYIATKEDITKYKKKKVVFTNGCFDILHLGHIEYLRKSKELGDYLVVGLNSDRSIRKLKGIHRPINRQEARKKVLESLSFVDKVIIFDDESSYNLIESIKPDIITKGGDYTFDTVVGNNLAEVVIIPFVDGYSTTDIINKL